MSDDLAEAIKRQRERAEASAGIDRRGWSDDEWIADAERLMNEQDGAVTSLLNGHVMALLRKVKALRECARHRHTWDRPYSEERAIYYGTCVVCGTTYDIDR